MSSPIDAALRLAIADKRLIEVGYGGRLRVVEPHDYGVKGGATMLLAYQLTVEGRRAMRDVGWRLLHVSRIESCRVTDDTFPGGRGESSQRHMTWDQLFARVGSSGRPRRQGPAGGPA